MTEFLRKLPTSSKQFIFLCLLNICWSQVNLAVKTASEFCSPAAIGVLRWVCFSLLIWLFLLIPKVRTLTKFVLPNKADSIKLFLIGLLLAGPAHALYYVALQTAGIGETTVINTTGPLWTTLFAIAILREKVTGFRWTAITFGAFGAYIVAVGFTLPQFSDSSTAANLLYFSGALMECLATVLAISLLRRSSGIGALAVEVSGIAVAQLLLPLLLPGLMVIQFTAFPPQVVASFLYLIFVAGIFCFGSWYVVAESAPVSSMMITLGIQAPIAAFIGWKFLGEKITSEMIIGATLIFLALIIGAYDSKKTAEREHHENALEQAGFPASIGPS